MAMPATQIRRGMVLVFEGEPCRVIEFRHHTPGNLRAMVQAKLKNLRTGSSFEHRFRAADSIEKASMETHDLEFMYQGGDTYHFMNVENYDQLEMDEEMLGDNAQWMQPGMRIVAEYYDGRPIGIQLPNTLTLYAGKYWLRSCRFGPITSPPFRTRKSVDRKRIIPLTTPNERPKARRSSLGKA